MARRSFRDRFFTPKVAQAIMSPGGILLAGAGAAVAIIAGAPLVVAAGCRRAGVGRAGARRRRDEPRLTAAAGAQ